MTFTTDLQNALHYLSKSGGFLTSKSADGVNCMTISWGFVGFFWNKPMFITGVRPQRHTKFILDNSNNFTVSIPYGNLTEELNICGTKTGANFDKSKVVQYVNGKTVESPIVNGCNMYYECKIVSSDQMNGNVLPENVKKTFYQEDYHYLYFGEIIDCYNNIF